MGMPVGFIGESFNSSLHDGHGIRKSMAEEPSSRMIGDRSYSSGWSRHPLCLPLLLAYVIAAQGKVVHAGPASARLTVDMMEWKERCMP